MFDTIILLTGSVEQATLGAALLRHNPHLTLLPAETLEELNAIDPRRLRRARLIAFASPVIVPGRLLRRLGYGAYNFHPGPPNYPGWAPSHFAVYDRATRFGVTAHVMHERVDSGPIVDVDLFDIPASMSVAALDEMAYARLARQFFSLAQPLATSRHALPGLPIQWCGRKNTRRHCAELCNILPDISPDELKRRMAAFGDGRLGIAPAVNLHGQEHRCTGTDTVPVTEAKSLAAEQNVVPAIPA
jgi:hypothetical protein